MAKEEVVDTEREVYTQRKWHGRKNTFVSVILIIVLLTLGFYGFSWASSDMGRQKLSSFWYSVKTTYNPLYWYGEQLKGAQSFGNIWATSSNATAEKIGIKFQAFESVGGKIIPSGAPLALKYKLDVGEGVDNVPLKLKCDIKKDKDKEYTTEDAIVEQGSKIFLPVEEPKISTENPLSYSNILCQLNTKPQPVDNIIINARGIVKFPFKQRNSLRVYFTKDAVNIGRKFFEKEGLKEKLPILSKYSNEPVELGIGVSDENTQPVIIGENQYPAVGISLKNRWDGRVTKINTMDLMLPEGVKINKERNKNPNILCPFDEGTSTGKYTKYSAKEAYLPLTEFGKGLEQTLETYQRFFCWLEISDTVLGEKPYNDKEYHVDISYEYEFSPKIETITLKKFIGEGGETTSIIETKYYLCKDKTTGQYSCETSCASNCEKCDTYNTQQECETDKTLYQGTI